MHVNNAAAPGLDVGDDEPFIDYLERLRDRAGIGSWVELAERIQQRGVMPKFNPTLFSKWRSGAVEPGTASLREVAIVLGVRPLDLFLRSGVVQSDDIEEREVDPVYRELLALDREMAEHESEQVRTDELYRLRSHIAMLTRGYRSTLDEAAGDTKPLRRRRRRATGDGDAVT